MLENHGEICADYELRLPDSLFAGKFCFTPMRGRLEPKENVPIEVRFCSDALGEFQETFVGQLTGQPAPLPLILKGRVVGPSFHFSLEQVYPDPNPTSTLRPTLALTPTLILSSP